MSRGACKDSRADKEALGTLNGRVLQVHSLNEALLQPANLFILVHCHGLYNVAADEAVCFLLVGESGDAEARLAEILHVVIHSLVDACQQLERFIDAGCRDKSVRGRDGRDDVLHDTHSLLVIDTFDAILGSPLLGFLANPLHVFRAVLVNRALVVLFPLDDESILDAVLG